MSCWVAATPDHPAPVSVSLNVAAGVAEVELKYAR